MEVGWWDFELKENNDDLWEVSYARANSLCDWAGSSRAAKTVGLSGWRTGRVKEAGMRGRGGGGGAVHHAVRTCCRHPATSQICVWNSRSIRMGSTIKGTKRDRKKDGRAGRGKKNFKQSHAWEWRMLLRLWRRQLWVLSDTDDHSARCEVMLFHKETQSCLQIYCTSLGSQFEELRWAQCFIFVFLHCMGQICWHTI